MVNIGEITKPSVGVTPVKPRRSTTDSELTTPADNIGATVKVSSEVYPKKRKSPRQQKLVDEKDNQGTEEKAGTESDNSGSTVEVKLEQNDNSKDDPNFEDSSYDENGHLSHHGKIDIKA